MPDEMPNWVLDHEAKERWVNKLLYGDNLEILRERIASDSIDLIYLDPPFNSNRSYNVLFGHREGSDSRAQIEAFDDTWTWSQETERVYFDLINGGAPGRAADAILAMHGLLEESDILAYLVMMTARLVELHRALKPNGTLYLHCDPTASHYLKILMDAVFGPERFLNEVTWRRTHSHGNVGRNFGAISDVLLVYTKGKNYTWNQQYSAMSPAYIESTFSTRTMTDDVGSP
jgi:adenine specific DNA methylase Mod